MKTTYARKPTSDARVGRPADARWNLLVTQRGLAGSLWPMDLGPEQRLDWKDAVVWLRHSESAKPQPIELPREIADLDETARNEWEWDWQLTTPEGRAYSAERFFLTNQNYYATVANDGEFQIDGVPEGTFDLAVRGFRVLGEEEPRSAYYSKKSITVKAPLDEPFRLDAWQMVDAETWRKSLATPEQETPPPKVAIHRVVAHKNALPFGRGGNDAEPRRIRFGTRSSRDPALMQCDQSVIRSMGWSITQRRSSRSMTSRPTTGGSP